MSNLAIKEKIKHVVTADQSPYHYKWFVSPRGDNCHLEGETISMHELDYAKMCGVQQPGKSKPSNPWPKWELINGVPRPAQGNMYTIEAGEFICIDIAALECRPDVLYLNYKGDCILTQCDKEPVADEMTDHTDWSGPMLNERTFLLSEDPLTCKEPQKIYIFNPSEGAVVLSAVLYRI